MTRLVIKDDEQEHEQVLEFSLAIGEGGRVELRVSDGDEHNLWYVASILPSGVLKLHSFVPKLDFFQIDGDDKYIKVEYE